jgi:hypothetical protein
MVNWYMDGPCPNKGLGNNSNQPEHFGRGGEEYKHERTKILP